MAIRVNLKLLGGLLGGTVLLGAGTHFLYKAQVERNATALLGLVDRAEEQGRTDRALRLLGRYLAMRPRDVGASLRYSSLLEPLARTPKAKGQILGVLDQALLAEPGRHDVRRRAAALAVEANQFDEALVHLDVLKDAYPQDAELKYLWGRCSEARGEYADARNDYRESIRLNPDSVEPHVALARLLRRRFDQPVEADKVMKGLAEGRKPSVTAYLARARYEKEFHGSLAAMAEDVAAALRLAPDDPQVLLTAGELALELKKRAAEQNKPDEASARLDEARAYLEQGLRHGPRTFRIYQALAEMELSAGQRRKAIAWLHRGLKEVPDHPELLSPLADLLIREGDVAGARETVAKLRKMNLPSAPLDLLEARAYVREGNFLTASHSLEDLRPQLVKTPELVPELDLLLGQCYQQLGDERQLTAFRRAADADPKGVAARLGVASALLSGGRMEEAIAEYERVVRLPTPPAGAWVLLARAMVLRNLSIDPEKAPWGPVHAALDKAAEAAPEAVEVIVLRAEALAAEERFEEARRALEDARAKKPKQVELWIALAGLAKRQGKRDELVRILDNAGRETGDSVELRLAWLRHLDGFPPEVAEKRLAQAAEGRGRFPPADQARLLRGLAEAFFRADKTAEAVSLGKELAALQPNDLRVRLFLFDAACRADDQATLGQVLGEVRRLDGGGILWRFGEACRLIHRAKHGQRELLGEARARLDEVARRRGDWSRVALCRAEIAELEGNAEKAIEFYRQAIEQGDHQFGVTLKLVQLLYDRQRYVEADEVLRKLHDLAPISGEMNRLAAEVSLLRPDPERALKYARLAVAKEPNDYRDCIWLSRFLWAANRKAEAEAPLRRAIELDPSAADAWVALVQHLARLEKREEAKEVIEKARGKLDPRAAPLVLAQCQEAIGETAAAEESYQAALAARPNDGKLLHRVADFYLREGQAGKAIPCLRRMLEARAGLTEAEVAWTRRGLAFALAMAGDYRQFREALALLEENVRGKEVALDDLRARATLWLTRPSHRREAVQALEELRKRQPLTPQQQFLLCGLYEAEGNWPKARDAIQSALAADGNNPLYLVQYVATLLRQDERSEARVGLNRLEQLYPQAFETVSLRARLLARDGKGEELVEAVREYVGRKDATPGDRADRVRLAAELLEELSQEHRAVRATTGPVAEEFYRQGASLKEPEGTLALAQYLGRQGRLPEALEQCARARAKGSPEAVAAVSIAVLRCGQPTEAQCQDFERWLAAQVEKRPDSATLRESLAALREIQGRYAEAEVLYRKILARDKTSAAASNNLAYLLALQGDHQTEALGLITGLIETTGPAAELLDTRAVVQLAAGRTDAAIADLQEALHQKKLAPIRFHLAWAYEKAGKRADAARTFQETLAAGLSLSTLHPLERATYERLAATLGAKGPANP